MKYKKYKNIKFDFESLKQWDSSLKEKVFKDVFNKIYNFKNLVVFDIGANTGVFSEIFAKFADNKLYLFEPVPEIYAYCASKFVKNRNVKVENLALSNKNAKDTLWVDNVNFGWNTLEKDKITSGMRTIKVQSITFDEYVRKHSIKKIDLIKIDVEGAEYKVIEGMKKTLKSLKNKPLIFCEIGWGKNHPHWNKEKEIFEWLFNNGYQRIDYHFDSPKDVLFVPNKTDDGNKITIGIPTRNRIKPLMDLLESISTQTFKNFDLIIADDGDKYDLKAEIRKVFPDLKFKYLKGKSISLPVNRQTILDNAKTELVLMCDDDHVLKEDCVDVLVKTIRVDGNIGMVSAIWPQENSPTLDFEKIKNNEEFKLDINNIDLNSNPRWLNNRGLGRFFYHPNHILETQICGGGCVLYRKSVINAVGGFPDYYSRVSLREDTDMSYRVFLSGYKVLTNTAAVAYHHKELVGGTRDSIQREKLMQEDEVLFLKKLSLWRESIKNKQNNPEIGKLISLAQKASLNSDLTRAKELLMQAVILAPNDMETAKNIQILNKKINKLKT